MLSSSCHTRDTCMAMQYAHCTLQYALAMLIAITAHRVSPQRALIAHCDSSLHMKLIAQRLTMALVARYVSPLHMALIAHCVSPLHMALVARYVSPLHMTMVAHCLTTAHGTDCSVSHHCTWH